MGGLYWILRTSKEADYLLPWCDMASNSLWVHVCLERGVGGLVHLGSYDLDPDEVATPFRDLLRRTSYIRHSLLDHPEWI